MKLVRYSKVEYGWGYINNVIMVNIATSSIRTGIFLITSFRHGPLTLF